MEPHVAKFYVIILSPEQLNGLCAHLNLGLAGLSLPIADDADDADVIEAMKALRSHTRAGELALCRKTRDAATGVQRRWSLVVRSDGGGFTRWSSGPTSASFSTYDTPVWHRPKDECGGGSAWAAGFIHGVHFASDTKLLVQVMRHADLLAALCQESAGDFSRVTAAELAAAEATFADKDARLPSAGADAALVAAAPEPAAARREIEATLAGLRSAGALAILRAKGPAAAAVARGVELHELGCAAMEVTLDSPEWEAILTGLRAALPPTVLLGVGTVMDDTVSLLPRLKALGATFALSPIDPVGFVGECQRLGLLAIPSAFTSNECWACLLYTSPSPRDQRGSRMPSSA